MATTKEDQMRNEFYAVFPKFAGLMEMEDAGAIGHLDAIGARHGFAIWKACAESYEKKLEAAEQKLAEKDAELDKQISLKKDYEQRATTLEAQLFAGMKQLSEANARNAMLFEALTSAKFHLGLEGLQVDFINEAISANSEAVAAWEAEKLAANKVKG